MQGLIRQARYCLEEFTSPELGNVQKIPFQILNEAKGIVFLTVLKGGIGLGGTFGTGIIIARDRENSSKWHGPIAIALNGLQLGLNIGIQHSDHIIILRDDNDVDTFMSNGQFRLEGDASIALGTMGRDTNMALSVNDKGYMQSASYSLTKGAYIGISLEGQIITLQHDCNDEYFGDKFVPLDVLKGNVKTVPFNADYDELCHMLNNYIFKQKSEYLETFIKDEISHNHETKNISDNKETITETNVLDPNNGNRVPDNVTSD